MVLSLRTDRQPAIQSGSGQTRDVERDIGSEQRRLIIEISSDDTTSTRATTEKKCVQEIKTFAAGPSPQTIIDCCSSGHSALCLC